MPAMQVIEAQRASILVPHDHLHDSLDPDLEATGSGLPGRHRGVTRQALLLDVKEALVDEFVDAEGA